MKSLSNVLTMYGHAAQMLEEQHKIYKNKFMDTKKLYYNEVDKNKRKKLKKDMIYFKNIIDKIKNKLNTIIKNIELIAKDFKYIPQHGNGEPNTKRDINVNIVFLRHGFGCHNLGDLLTVDPLLTEMGVEATKFNGCVIAEQLINNGITHIDLVGCSPAIRALETADFITDSWVKKFENEKFKRIFVFPFLREIDENTLKNNSPKRQEIYSENSRRNIEVPTLRLRHTEQTKIYFSENKSTIYDYRYINDFRLPDSRFDDKIRNEPGDIYRFLRYLEFTLFSDVLKNTTNNTLNLCIITHHGVLNAYAKSINRDNDVHLHNNNGFILKLKMSSTTIQPSDFIPINAKFNDYNKADLKYHCPSDRCSKYCTEHQNEWEKGNRTKINMGKCTSTKLQYKNDTIKYLSSSPNKMLDSNIKPLFKEGLTDKEYEDWFINGNFSV